MCSSFHFSRYFGCYLIGLLNILMSLTITTASIVILKMDPGHTHLNTHNTRNTILLSCLGIEKKYSDMYILTLLTISLTGLLFSSILIYGLIKKKQNLVLSYFVFGVLQAILVLLMSLLELIHQLWQLSMAQIIITIMYIHGLMVIHRVYEDMWKEAKNTVPYDFLDESFLIDNEITADSNIQTPD